MGLIIHILSVISCPQAPSSKGSFWCLLFRTISISNIELLTSYLACSCHASWNILHFELTPLHVQRERCGWDTSMTFFLSWWAPRHSGDSQITHHTLPPQRSRHTAQRGMSRGAGAPCTTYFGTLLLHPLSVIITPISQQHKEMDIKIQDTAAQFLPNLGLSCCFIALPSQVLTDDSFYFPPLMVWCIQLPPHLCTVGEILALCKWIFNSACHTSAAWDLHIPTS